MSHFIQTSKSMLQLMRNVTLLLTFQRYVTYIMYLRYVTLTLTLTYLRYATYIMMNLRYVTSILTYLRLATLVLAYLRYNYVSQCFGAVKQFLGPFVLNGLLVML